MELEVGKVRLVPGSAFGFQMSFSFLEKEEIKIKKINKRKRKEQMTVIT